MESVTIEQALPGLETAAPASSSPVRRPSNLEAKTEIIRRREALSVLPGDPILLAGMVLWAIYSLSLNRRPANVSLITLMFVIAAALHEHRVRRRIALEREDRRPLPRENRAADEPSYRRHCRPPW